MCSKRYTVGISIIIFVMEWTRWNFINWSSLAFVSANKNITHMPQPIIHIPLMTVYSTHTLGIPCDEDYNNYDHKLTN